MADVEWNPETYLEQLTGEFPQYVEFQDAVAAATDGLEVDDVLELGTGTGETARRVLERHPQARWTGIDNSTEMLQRAAGVLPNADLRRARFEDALPQGPFDLVVSALAIHHLDSAGKRDLFRRVYDVLRRGGTFVLADVVVPDDPADAQVEIDWVVDLPDRLDDQLEWLRDVGFDVETRWAVKDLAVVRAMKREPGPRAFF